MTQHRSKESRPRQGEILVYFPTEGKGEIYGSKEGRTYGFDLKTSPGLNPDILRPGIPVTYIAVQNGDGARAVEVQLEEAGSLEARLRSVRKRLGGRPSRPQGLQVPSVLSSSRANVTSVPAGDDVPSEPSESKVDDNEIVETIVETDTQVEADQSEQVSNGEDETSTKVSEAIESETVAAAVTVSGADEQQNSEAKSEEI